MNISHACELDVYVQRAEEAADLTLPTEHELPQQLMGGLEVVVGSAPLAVRSALEPRSERIGTLPPGQPLRVLKVESLQEHDQLCACIMLEHTHNARGGAGAGGGASSKTFRSIYPADPGWRTPRLRKMWKADEMRVVKEEAMARNIDPSSCLTLMM